MWSSGAAGAMTSAMNTYRDCLSFSGSNLWMILLPQPPYNDFLKSHISDCKHMVLFSACVRKSPLLFHIFTLGPWFQVGFGGGERTNTLGVRSMSPSGYYKTKCFYHVP